MLVRAPRNSLTRRCIHESGAAEGREKKIAKDEREDRTIGLPFRQRKEEGRRTTRTSHFDGSKERKARREIFRARRL